MKMQDSAKIYYLFGRSVCFLQIFSLEIIYCTWENFRQTYETKASSCVSMKFRIVDGSILKVIFDL